MDCRKVEENLSFYVDGTLSPDEAEMLSRHLEVCPRCQEEWQRECQITSGLRMIGSTIYPAPDKLREDILHKLSDDAVTRPAAASHKAWRNSLIGVAAAATLALGIYTFNQPTAPLPEVALVETQGTVPAQVKPDSTVPPTGLTGGENTDDPDVIGLSPEVTAPENSAAADDPEPQTAPADILTAPVEPEENAPENTESPVTDSGILTLGATENSSPARLMSAINDTEQTLLQIVMPEGSDPAVELTAIAQAHQGRIRSLGAQNAGGKQYIAQQITVNRAEASSVFAAVSALGQVTWQQTDPVLLSGHYQELWEQNLLLEQQLQAAADTAGRTALVLRQEGVRAEMNTLAEQSEEAVIIVWVEQ
jgi:anti-sigma factor (TIGR02949 family)